MFKLSRKQQHIAIKQPLLKQSVKHRKYSHDSLQGIHGVHYDDTKCNVCNVTFPSAYQSEQHIESTKHLKKLLQYHSNDYNKECIYCDVTFQTKTDKNNHLSSIQHHTEIAELLKQFKPKTNRSNSDLQPVLSTENITQIHLKGIYGKHYDDTYCNVCNVPFDSSNSANLSAHLIGSKHIKNMLSFYSGNYQNKCIYCDTFCNTDVYRHSHISSLKHSNFINSIIDASHDDKNWIISLDECQNMIKNNITPKSVKTVKTVSTSQSMSAAKLRAAIRDCYDDNSVNSIDQQLNLLSKLHKRSSSLNQKDYLSILFCVSSLMRSNNTDIISNGFIRICKLFEDDIETDIIESKWKMNHILFENIIDMVILSVNIREIIRVFDELIIETGNNSMEAFTKLLGISAEKQFLEPFNMFFEYFGDITRWEVNSFFNDNSHKYFMKFSKLLFDDMLFHLRDIRNCQQNNFDAKYKQIIKQYSHNISNINTDMLFNYCSFIEINRNVSGPFTTITLETKLDEIISTNSKGSFIILFTENTQTNVIDYKNVFVGYIYSTTPMSYSMKVRIADHDNNIPLNNIRWHALSLGASGVSFESQFEALQKITNVKDNDSVSPKLKEILYNYDPSVHKDDSAEKELNKLIDTPLLLELNESQRNAVSSALNNDITLIQGPPGTGKTHVAAAIVEQYLKLFQTKLSKDKPKILLSAYSNIAVDVLTERVTSYDYFPIRMGYDSTLNPDIFSHVLLNTQPVYAWSDKIDYSEIICSTCIGSSNELLKKVKFDLILMDETTQSTESGLLVALSKLKQSGNIVLIGDHKQLPPTVLSPHAKQNGLDLSLFERLICDNNICPNFLNIQYRMHPRLAEFPSLYFYDNNLLTGIDKNDRNIPQGFNWPINGFPIAFVQVNNGYEENKLTSKLNRNEADIVVNIVCDLIKNNDNNDNITVITPYAAQRKLIDDILNEKLNYTQKKRVKIRTIDGFQGSECDIIIFSATRCNDDAIVGFLRDHRRVNVMLTRTKKGLIVVGDMDTLSKGDPLWNNWIQYVCHDNKAVVNLDIAKEENCD